MLAIRSRRAVAISLGVAALLVGSPLAAPAGAAPAVARQAAGGSTQAIADVLGWFPAGAGFVPVGPTRLVDTRTAGLKIPASGVLDVSVAGVAGVPTSGVAAAVLNVTATEPVGGGFVTAFATGAAQPGTSNLNYEPGQTVANLVTSALGTGGAVRLYTLQSTHLVVDLVGYFSAGSFVPLTPTRVVDTRSAGGPVGVGASVQAAVGTPPGATALVNLTATEPRGGGYLRAWPSGGAVPPTSNVNYDPRSGNAANLAFVPVGADGQITVSANAAATQVIVDVLGYLPAGAVTMMDATRVLDTRSGQGGVSGPVASGTTFDVAVAGQGAGMTLSSGTEVTARAAVPATGVGAVILNLTLTEPTGGGFATVFPSGTAWPGTSNVNVVGGQTAANLTIVPLGANGAASVYVQAAPPPPPPPAGPPIPPGLEFAPSKRGDRGPHVKSLQTYLTFSSFWMGTPEGSYGQLTQQAVMAFQKYVGLPASGTADARTVQTLVDFHRSGQWPQARSTSGNLIEVDKTKQLLFVIRNGRVLLTINTSTGTEQSYREWSDLLQTWITGFSHTYEGVLRVYREAATGWTEGELGQIYRPKYIKGGVAIHGSSSIPNYPASHGCIRVTTAFMDTVWDYNLAPMGSTVWVYR